MLLNFGSGSNSSSGLLVLLPSCVPRPPPSPRLGPARWLSPGAAYRLRRKPPWPSPFVVLPWRRDLHSPYVHQLPMRLWGTASQISCPLSPSHTHQPWFLTLDLHNHNAPSDSDFVIECWLINEKKRIEQSRGVILYCEIIQFRMSL